MEHGVNADTHGDTTGIHGSMTAVAATARQHHDANTDNPTVLLPQTTADSPTVYIAYVQFDNHLLSICIINYWIIIVIGYYNMTAISASRRKTNNRVLEVSALAVQAYAILELNELEPWKLEARNTGNKANAGTRRRQAKKFWVRQWLLS